MNIEDWCVLAHLAVYFAQLVLAIAFALLIGVIYLQLDDAFPAGLQNR